MRLSRLRTQRPFLRLRLRQLLRVVIYRANLLRSVMPGADRAVESSKSARGRACEIAGMSARRMWP